MLTSLAFFNWAVYGSYMSEITTFNWYADYVNYFRTVCIKFIRSVYFVHII